MFRINDGLKLISKGISMIFYPQVTRPDSHSVVFKRKTTSCDKIKMRGDWENVGKDLKLCIDKYE